MWALWKVHVSDLADFAELPKAHWSRLVSDHHPRPIHDGVGLVSRRQRQFR